MSKHDKIPDYLLADCTPQDKWMMENVFELKQKVTTLGETVARVEVQTKLTNGRTTKSEENIEALQEQIKSWLNLKSNFLKAIKNKYVICGLGVAVFLFLYPLAIYVSKVGGPLSFFETVAKSIWG